MKPIDTQPLIKLAAILREWRKDDAWLAHTDPIAYLAIRRAQRRPGRNVVPLPERIP